MAGDPNVTDKLLKGYHAGDRIYKVHLDGYNLDEVMQKIQESGGSK